MSFQQSAQQSATAWIFQIQQGMTYTARKELFEHFHGFLFGLTRKRLGNLKIIIAQLEPEFGKVPEP